MVDNNNVGHVVLHQDKEVDTWHVCYNIIMVLSWFTSNVQISLRYVCAANWYARFLWRHFDHLISYVGIRERFHIKHYLIGDFYYFWHLHATALNIASSPLENILSLIFLLCNMCTKFFIVSAFINHSLAFFFGNHFIR